MEVVAGPARAPRLRDRYGLTVAAELPGLIADDLLADRESPVAPMLQILLTGMWEAAKRGTMTIRPSTRGCMMSTARRGWGWTTS